MSGCFPNGSADAKSVIDPTFPLLGGIVHTGGGDKPTAQQQRHHDATDDPKPVLDEF